jgi:hypothetical protein
MRNAIKHAGQRRRSVIRHNQNADPLHAPRR